MLNRSLVSLIGFLVVASSGCSQLPTNIDLATLLDSSKQHQHTAHQSVSGGGDHHPAASLRDRMFASARKAEEHGNVENAIAHYKKLTEQFPDDVASLHRLAVLQDTHGDDKDSARLYLRAMHFAPNDADLLTDYGYSRYIHGDVLQAESTLRRAVEVAPTHARAHTNLGLVLAQRGMDAEAIASFQRAGLTKEQSQENLRQVQHESSRSSVTAPPNLQAPSQDRAIEQSKTPKLSQEQLLEALTARDDGTEQLEYQQPTRSALRRD